MSAPLSTYWTTIAVTALPPGWVNVSENSSPDIDGTLLFAYPCPAVLLQERLADGERDTRAVAARFDAGELEPAGDDVNHYATMTAHEWEAAREEVEHEVSIDRARIKSVLLDRITHAGAEGISHVKLFDAAHPAHRALAVGRSLQQDGLVTTAVRPNPELPTGRERVYWLKGANSKGDAR